MCNPKGKKETNKNKSHIRPKQRQNPSNGASSFKKDKHKRFENTKCSYCKTGNHPQNLCMNKTIDQMPRQLEQNNIPLLKGHRKLDPRNKTEDHERCHALNASFSQSQDFFIDFGASNDMVSSKQSFPSLESLQCPRIHMGKVQFNLSMQF